MSQLLQRQEAKLNQLNWLQQEQDMHSQYESRERTKDCYWCSLQTSMVHQVVVCLLSISALFSWLKTS